MKYYNPKNIKLIELTKKDTTMNEMVSGNFSDKHTITIEFMNGSFEYEEFENFIDARRRMDWLETLLK